MNGTRTIQNWPKESREAAELVIKEHGEPDEATDSQLTWHDRAPWKRIVATKAYYDHAFPIPHIDCIESFVDYRVPPAKFAELAEFDGSVICERTAGEVSARCHDLQANCLALNLMHDIVIGRKTVAQAREYYGREVLNFRRKQPTPYMQKLNFRPMTSGAPDKDERTVPEESLKQAQEEGKAKAHA